MPNTPPFSSFVSAANPDPSSGQVSDTPELSRLSRWVARFTAMEVPVLRSTREVLKAMRENEDDISANDISKVILRDPMLTLRVLRFLQEHRTKSQSTDITTVGHAIMMLGVTTFFNQFNDMQIVEDILQDMPEALDGFRKVVNRTRCAALYAHDFAELHHDIESDEVVVAALLHDVAEMLLWCFAPESAIRIARHMKQDKTLRSVVVQNSELGCRLIDLQLTLIREWHLPRLLGILMDDSRAGHDTQARARIVGMAVSLARHSAAGWGDAALPDDYAAIHGFFNLPLSKVIERVQDVTVSAIPFLEETTETRHQAVWLPSLSLHRYESHRTAKGEDSKFRVEALRLATEYLSSSFMVSQSFSRVLVHVLNGIHTGLGFQRVLFMGIDHTASWAVAKYVMGIENIDPLRDIHINLTSPHFFSSLMSDGGVAWYKPGESGEVQHCIPPDVLSVIGDREFFAMAVLVDDKPVGFIYVDDNQEHSTLFDAVHYEGFQKLCLLLIAMLEKEPEILSGISFGLHA